MESDGAPLGEVSFKGSKIVLKGGAFETVSMGATYKGTVAIDPTTTPKTLDLTFTEGPEKGDTCPGIYEFDGGTWKICLAVGRTERPTAFATKAGSGLVLETLKREAGGGADAVKRELARLDGEWAMASGKHDGHSVPDGLLASWKRMAKGNETTLTFGGRVVFKATFVVDPGKKPRTIDYTLTDGPDKGKTQLGIYEWDGETVRFCFAGPGKERPAGFESKAGDGLTVSEWKNAGK
jgi:uncharacterized protein (TIGR03067 family)